MKSERGIGIIALLFCIIVIGGFIAFSIYLIRLDNIVRDKFEGQRWDIPAKVFARPLEVYSNAPVSQTDFTQELKLLGYKNTDNYAKSGSYVSDGNTLFVPADEFKMEMTALKNAGYYTLSPEEAYRVLTTNEKPAEKIVWVTFDDGYKNAHDTAMPILTALGMKGSFFIITGKLGNEDTMTDEMLSELKANPLMSVGSHTVNHPDLEYSSHDVESDH